MIVEQVLNVRPNVVVNGALNSEGGQTTALHGSEVTAEDQEKLLENVYAYAYAFYQQGRLEEAENFFRYLCMYDFSNPEYALGLGAVFQLKKDYEQAIDVYGMVRLLSEVDFRPLLYAGQCHLMLKQRVEARKCFRAVVNGAEDEELRNKADRYLAMLDSRKSEPVKEADSTKE